MSQTVMLWHFYALAATSGFMKVGLQMCFFHSPEEMASLHERLELRILGMLDGSCASGLQWKG